MFFLLSWFDWDHHLCMFGFLGASHFPRLGLLDFLHIILLFFWLRQTLLIFFAYFLKISTLILPRTRGLFWCYPCQIVLSACLCVRSCLVLSITSYCLFSGYDNICRDFEYFLKIGTLHFPRTRGLFWYYPCQIVFVCVLVCLVLRYAADAQRCTVLTP